MELHEYETFKYCGGILIYAGKIDGIYYKCDECKRERKNTHEFLYFDRETDAYHALKSNDFSKFNSSYHLGTECINKFTDKFK